MIVICFDNMAPRLSRNGDGNGLNVGKSTNKREPESTRKHTRTDNGKDVKMTPKARKMTPKGPQEGPNDPQDGPMNHTENPTLVLPAYSLARSHARWLVPSPGFCLVLGWAGGMRVYV